MDAPECNPPEAAPVLLLARQRLELDVAIENFGTFLLEKNFSYGEGDPFAIHQRFEIGEFIVHVAVDAEGGAVAADAVPAA
jgi:hypothetical protein